MKNLKEHPIKKYYSSHGQTMPFSEFIELEVEERENYTMMEIRQWMRKYGFDLGATCIWVTPDKWMANRYNLDADLWMGEYKDIPEEEINVVEINSKDGFIIPESDDGDDGVLFIYEKGMVSEAKTYDEFLKLLQEGYLWTYDLGFTVRRIRNLLSNVKNTIDINRDTSDFQIYIDEKIDYIFLEQLHKLLLSFGYFISVIIYNTNKKFVYDLNKASKLDFDNISDWCFQVERHKNEKIKYNGILYHTTLKRKIEKISKLGLCPKSDCKTLAHPDRIYLSYDMNQVDEILRLMNEYEREERAIIELEVIGLEICSDPNSRGCYTTDNIISSNIANIYDNKWDIIKSWGNNR